MVEEEQPHTCTGRKQHTTSVAASLQGASPNMPFDYYYLCNLALETKTFCEQILHPCTGARCRQGAGHVSPARKLSVKGELSTSAADKRVTLAPAADRGRAASPAPPTSPPGEHATQCSAAGMSPAERSSSSCPTRMATRSGPNSGSAAAHESAAFSVSCVGARTHRRLLWSVAVPSGACWGPSENTTVTRQRSRCGPRNL